MREYRRLLVPYDFSNHARIALDTALDFVRHFKADLHLVHVLQPPFYALPGFADMPAMVLTDMRESLRQSLRQVAAKITDAPGRVECHVLEGANIATLIAQSATEIGADLIVMGTHGRTGLKHAFMGSVAERTLRSAPCPVLTVRASEEGLQSEHQTAMR